MSEACFSCPLPDCDEASFLCPIRNAHAVYFSKFRSGRRHEITERERRLNSEFHLMWKQERRAALAERAASEEAR